MATTNNGNNVTTIVVAFIGMVGALGGAWITTRSANNPAAPPAVVQQAAVPQAAVNGDQPVQSVAPAVVPGSAPSSAPAGVGEAPTPGEVAPPALPDSRSIAYGRAWSNDQRGTALVLETVEVANDRVRLHLRFDAPAEGAVTFYTTGETGLRALLGDKKPAPATIVGTGGALFADPGAVTLPAGSRTTGWIDYTLNERKMVSLSIGLTSTTEGYLGQGRQTITYQPLKFKLDK